MPLPIVAAILPTVLGVLLCLVAVFLILLILVQRGRGGGLAGALGGMGGSSAFGAKAGDVFTRITIVAATIWIVLCIAAARIGTTGESRLKVRGPVGRLPPRPRPERRCCHDDRTGGHPRSIGSRCPSRRNSGSASRRSPGSRGPCSGSSRRVDGNQVNAIKCRHSPAPPCSSD